MIYLAMGTVKEPWYRRWLRLKPRTWLFIQNDETEYRKPVARFVGDDSPEEFWAWMGQQGEQIAQLVRSVIEMERENK